MSDEDWRALIDTNVSGSFYMARAAVRAMKRQGGGAIINMASDAGLVGVPNAAAYSATKGAIVQLTKGIALDYAREGIRVNAVCPGETDTPMMDFVWRAEASSPAAVREKAKEYVPDGPGGRTGRCRPRRHVPRLRGRAAYNRFDAVDRRGHERALILIQGGHP